MSHSDLKFNSEVFICLLIMFTVHIIHTAKFEKEKRDVYFILQRDQAHLPQPKRSLAALFLIDRNQQRCQAAKGKLLARSVEGEALVNGASQNIRNLGIAWALACQQPCAHPTG